MENSPEQPDAAEAFVRLVSRHDRQLATYVFALVGNSADADDVLQEAKVTLWKQFDKFEPGTNFLAWARKVVMNQVLNYRRGEKRRPTTPADQEFIEAVAEEIDRRAEELDLRSAALKNCLAKLPEIDRNIIVWRYQDECGVAEIAAKTRRSTEAVYQVLSRIRQKLGECVGRQISQLHST